MFGDILRDFLRLLGILAVGVVDAHALAGVEAGFETFGFLALGAAPGVFVVVEYQIIDGLGHERGVGIVVEEVLRRDLAGLVVVGVVVELDHLQVFPGQLEAQVVEHEVAFLHVLVVGVGLQVRLDLIDGVCGVGLVEAVVGAGLVDGLDAAEEGVLGVFGVGVAAHVVAEVEGGHVVVAVLVVGVGEEEEDGVGARGAEREGVEFLEEAGGGEPLLVVVELHRTGVVLVERLECDALVVHAAALGGFRLDGAHGVRLCGCGRHNSVRFAAEVSSINIHRKA